MNASCAAQEQLAQRDSQLPQAFAPMPQESMIAPGDYLQATCTYDSRGRYRPTHAGANHGDEMCNLCASAPPPTPV